MARDVNGSLSDSPFFGSYEASAVTGFGGNRLARAAEKRPDGPWFKAQWARPDALCFYFVVDRPVLRVGDGPPDPRFPASEAEAFGAELETRAFLGFEGDAPVFAAALTGDPETIRAELEASGSRKLIDLRSLAAQGAVTPQTLGALAQGRSLSHWHATHRFCANCGAPTDLAEAGYRRDCPACNHKHFPRTDPVAIWLALSGDDCLLGRSSRFADKMYSCLAGFIEPGETIEDAVRRENKEEAGVPIGRVTYHASQPWPFPASLMVGCYAEALDRTITMDEEELVDCRWFSRDEVASMLKGVHPEGLTVPPPMSIAWRIITDFVERAE